MIVQLALALIIVLLFVLIKRVSALGKMIEEINIKLTPPAPPAPQVKAAPVPVKKPVPAETVSYSVPNAVIAAICAAVNQYRNENQ